MKEIIGYIREYFRYLDKKLLVLCTVQTAILIFLNYHDRLESKPYLDSVCGTYHTFYNSFCVALFLLLAYFEKKIFRE